MSATLADPASTLATFGEVGFRFELVGPRNALVIRDLDPPEGIWPRALPGPLLRAFADHAPEIAESLESAAAACAAWRGEIAARRKARGMAW